VRKGRTANSLKITGVEKNREESETEEKEASPGFEPGDNGFANRYLSCLNTLSI
jgi:hypothetical protein